MLNPGSSIRRLVCVVALLCSGLTGVCAAGGPISDSGSSDNRRVAVCATDDGDRLVAVWDGLVDGGRRILLRERLRGVWFPVEIVDAEPSSDNRSPALALDGSGNTHVAWLSAGPGGKRRVSVALRDASGTILQRGTPAGIDDGEAGAAPSVRLDEGDRPWIAWESGNGAEVVVKVARPASDGGFQVDSPTSGASGRNWYPELMLDDTAVVAWYAEQADGFHLRAARTDADGVWAALDVAGLTAIPAERLPHLAKRADGNMTACWIEDNGRADRVLLAVQGGGEAKAAGQDIDPAGWTDGGVARESLARFTQGDGVALAWTEKPLEATGGWAIKVAMGSRAPFRSGGVTVAKSVDGFYDHPAVTGAGGGRGLFVAWRSCAEAGGDGRIYGKDVALGVM